MVVHLQLTKIRPSHVKIKRTQVPLGNGAHFSSSWDLRTTVPFVTVHIEVFHHPVIPKSDLYFTFCSTLSKRTSK